MQLDANVLDKVGLLAGFILCFYEIFERFSVSYQKCIRIKSIKYLKNNLEGDIIQNCKGYHI